MSNGDVWHAALVAAVRAGRDPYYGPSRTGPRPVLRAKTLADDPMDPRTIAQVLVFRIMPKRRRRLGTPAYLKRLHARADQATRDRLWNDAGAARAPGACRGDLALRRQQGASVGSPQRPWVTVATTRVLQFLFALAPPPAGPEVAAAAARALGPDGGAHLARVACAVRQSWGSLLDPTSTHAGQPVAGAYADALLTQVVARSAAAVARFHPLRHPFDESAVAAVADGLHGTMFRALGVGVRADSGGYGVDAHRVARFISIGLFALAAADGDDAVLTAETFAGFQVTGAATAAAAAAAAASRARQAAVTFADRSMPPPRAAWVWHLRQRIRAAAAAAAATLAATVDGGVGHAAHDGRFEAKLVVVVGRDGFARVAHKSLDRRVVEGRQPAGGAVGAKHEPGVARAVGRGNHGLVLHDAVNA